VTKGQPLIQPEIAFGGIFALLAISLPAFVQTPFRHGLLPKPASHRAGYPKEDGNLANGLASRK